MLRGHCQQRTLQRAMRGLECCKRVLICSKYMEENMTCVTNRRIGLSAAIGVQNIENY